MGKLCKKCGQPGDFYKSNPTRCKVCVKGQATQWYADNTERAKANVAANRDPVAARTWQLKRLYNLTPEQFEARVREQNGVCHLCQRPPRGKARNDKVLHVDHDHRTGKVRRLLCSSCNRAIGLMQDEAFLLEKAAEYVREYS